MQERHSFLQLQIAAHAFPAARQRQLITSMRVGGPVGPGSIHGDRTPALISHPKLLISISGGSADQLPSTMSSAGGRVAHEEAGWRYSAEDCEAWFWPSSLCTG